MSGDVVAVGDFGSVAGVVVYDAVCVDVDNDVGIVVDCFDVLVGAVDCVVDYAVAHAADVCDVDIVVSCCC